MPAQGRGVRRVLRGSAWTKRLIFGTELVGRSIYAEVLRLVSARPPHQRLSVSEVQSNMPLGFQSPLLVVLVRKAGC
jgi:hypothetical protein